MLFLFPRRILLLAVLCCMQTACMLGADFHSPPPPPVATYDAKPLPAKTVATPAAGKSGKSQTFIYGQNIPLHWWELFHSKELNNLIEKGLAHSPNLQAAIAALKVAQETLNVQIGNLMFPAVNGSVSGDREKFSGSTIGSSTNVIFNLFNTSVNVTYVPDVFGASRRQLEATQAQVDYQQFQLIAAWLSLSANIVTTAISAASYQAQIKATLEIIRTEQNQLDILRKQFQLGGIAKDTVLTQETLVNQTRATLPPLQKSLSQAQHALAVLIGVFPNTNIPIIDLDKLHLPQHLPVSLPSYLVRQRPDVRAAEATLHTACANVGVATANLFPQINITGAFGWETSIPAQLFSTGTMIWSIGGSVTQPIFHGGALMAARRQAIASYNQAAAQYRQTVLTAFQNVADSLRAIETDARTLQAQQRAKDSALANLNLSLSQYRLGGTSYLLLLNAQEQYQSTLIATIQARAARYNDTAALLQALGGGWWNKQWCVKECLNAS